MAEGPEIRLALGSPPTARSRQPDGTASERREFEGMQMTDELERFRLDGRVAIVGGGSGGIGVRTCAALAGIGANVAIIGRSAARLDAAQRVVEKTGGRA